MQKFGVWSQELNGYLWWQKSTGSSELCHPHHVIVKALLLQSYHRLVLSFPWVDQARWEEHGTVEHLHLRPSLWWLFSFGKASYSLSDHQSLLFFSWSLMQNSLSLNRPFLLPFQLRWRCGGTAIPGKSTGLLMGAVRSPPWIRVGRAARSSFMRRVVFSSPSLAAFPGKRYVGKNRIFPPPMWVRTSQEAMGNSLKASWRNDDARAAQTSPRESLNCSLWSICSLILSSSCCSSVVAVWCRSGEKLGAFHMIGGFGCRDWSVEKLWGLLLAIWELNG